VGVRIAGLRRTVGVEGEDSPRLAALRATVSLLEGLEGVGEEAIGEVGRDILMVDVFDFDNSKGNEDRRSDQRR